jgi:hypothetical protein
VLCKDPDLRPGNADAVCYNHFVGNHYHPGGGVQILGGVLIAGDQNQTILYDIRDIANIRELPCGIPTKGGAAGIAWDRGNSVHVAVIGSGGSDQLYVTNGKPLDHPDCEFESVGQADQLEPPGEGLSQLYYDDSNRKLVSIGGRSGNNAGTKQVLTYQAFKLVGDSTSGFSIDESSPISIELDRSHSGSSLDPSLRWGGAVRMRSTSFDIVLAARALTIFGALNTDMALDVYKPSR